jgi:hypothetical protein
MRSVETVVSLSDTRGYTGLLAEGEVVVKVDRMEDETRVARAEYTIWHDEQLVRVWIDAPAVDIQPDPPTTTMADIWPI